MDKDRARLFVLLLVPLLACGEPPAAPVESLEAPDLSSLRSDLVQVAGARLAADLRTGLGREMFSKVLEASQEGEDPVGDFESPEAAAMQLMITPAVRQSADPYKGRDLR